MSQTNPPTLRTVKQFVAHNPAFTEGGVRKWIFEAATNGFHECIIRIGRKVMLDEHKTFQWVITQNAKISKEA